MREYFLHDTSPLLQSILKADKSFTPLDLASPGRTTESLTNAEYINRWKEKVLHGKYPAQLSSDNVDKQVSISFIRNGYLQPETEGFLFAIQDKVMRTRNYERHILQLNTNDVCRKCLQRGETIEHITAGCGQLSNNLYLSRHNQVAKIIHRQFALQYCLVKRAQPYYKYVPQPVLETPSHLLYWDRTIVTDKTVDFNRPDIVLIDKSKKVAFIIDIAVPLTANISSTENEKIAKYINLAIEMKRLWGLFSVDIVPLVISAEGVVTNRLRGYLETLNLPAVLLTHMQKAAILQTCHIVRKFFALG